MYGRREVGYAWDLMRRRRGGGGISQDGKHETGIEDTVD